jgi:hypothetical protein
LTQVKGSYRPLDQGQPRNDAANLLNAFHNNFLTFTGQDFYLAVDDTIRG